MKMNARIIKPITKCVTILVTTLLFCLFLIDTSYAKEVTILFTHDIHSYLDNKTDYVEGELREYGNIAKLSTLIKENANENTIYVDAGDIAMGTLYQAAFATDAFELRTLGEVGCEITAFGNHEFDYGCEGVTNQLKAAMASGDKLPLIVESSFDFSGELTDEQLELKEALDEYGVREYVVKDINGIKVAFFSVEGIDSIDCIQANLKFKDYIEAAKETVKAIGNQADFIVCLSHVGTDGDGENGEDFDLIKEVPEIDVVISGHSHTAYHDAIISSGTILGSAGSYFRYLGKMELDVTDGQVELIDYELIPIDESVKEDESIKNRLEGYKGTIRSEYLQEYANGGDFDDILTYSNFDMIHHEDMSSTEGEFDIGDLIADSYIYSAKKNGIDDIDVAAVGYGTIRGSIIKGPVSLANAFEICSLGVGSDGSAGHPIVTAYITGKELKLLAELDASLGSLVSSIKMSYSGLSVTYNNKRMILDRITDVHLVRDDGTTEEIIDDKLYKCAFNVYAGNMLGMVNGLTKGILSIVPKDEDGNPITDFYEFSLIDNNGNEIKEWVALKDYLASFGENGIPESYHGPQGRKNVLSEGGLTIFRNPGTTTKGVIILGCILIALLVIVVRAIIKNNKKKQKKNEGNS